MALTADEQALVDFLSPRLTANDVDLIHSGKAVYLNLPNPLGIEAGEHLARLTLTAPETPIPMCDECAFRRGTIPNGSPATAMTAFQCAVSGEEFHCHKGLDENREPTRVCGGWARWQSPTAAE